MISKNNLNDAVALIEFGIEEFGRAVALNEKLEAGSEDVELALFISHNYKYEKAWSVLPKGLKTIYERSYEGSFDVTSFDVGTLEKETISPRTRLDATFVNYDELNKEWKVGVQAQEEKLETVIKGIKKRIASFERGTSST